MPFEGAVTEKKYIVRLSDAKRETLREVIKKLKGSSGKVRRAQILLKADAAGPNWTDQKIAEAFACRTKTIENIRQRLVTQGFEIASCGKQRETPPRPKALDGKQEAKLIALRLGNARCSQCSGPLGNSAMMYLLAKDAAKSGVAAVSRWGH